MTGTEVAGGLSADSDNTTVIMNNIIDGGGSGNGPPGSTLEKGYNIYTGIAWWQENFDLTEIVDDFSISSPVGVNMQGVFRNHPAYGPRVHSVSPTGEAYFLINGGDYTKVNVGDNIEFNKDGILRTVTGVTEGSDPLNPTWLKFSQVTFTPLISLEEGDSARV